MLSSYPDSYQDLDYLKPIFEELNPPYFGGLPNEVLGDSREIKNATESFWTLAKIKYLHFVQRQMLLGGASSQKFVSVINKSLNEYIRLKLSHYAITEEIENLMVDDPFKAFMLLNMFRIFVTGPMDNLRSTIDNFMLEDTQIMKSYLPPVYHVEPMRLPCEIRKFLMKGKLTLAPLGLEACKDLIYHYESYDLQKILESLNEAIVTNHPDIVYENVEGLSEILDNIWNDQIIQKRIENIKIGVPISVAAIGGVAGGLVGGIAGVGTGGFLAELGFKVAEKTVEKFYNIKGEGISERLAKLRTKSYQANIYDFKKMYKGKITKRTKKGKV